MSSGPPESVAGAIEEIRGDLERCLGDRLLALYLTGSLVLGDFDPQLSDIDLLAVTSQQLSSHEFAELSAMHQAFADAHPEWDDRVEVAYVSLDDLDNFRSSVPQFPVISPGEPFHMREEPLAHWAANWFLIRESSIALKGGPASLVLPEVSRREFLASVSRYLAELTERASRPITPGKESYIVLTACRGLYALELGGQTSKRGGGLWMQHRYPQWGALVDRALEWRHGPHGPPRATSAETFALLDFVRSQFLGA